MSTETDRITAEVEKIKKDCDAQFQSVTSRGFIPEVEKAHLADIWLEGREKIDVLATEYQTAREREMVDLSRRAFGAEDLLRPGSDHATHQVSYRDAQERVEQADGQTALARLMKRADGSGDELLARAAATKAARMGWSDIVKAYDQTHPGWAEKAKDALEQQKFNHLASVVRFRLRKPAVIATMDRRAMEMHRDKVAGDLANRTHNPARDMIDRSHQAFHDSLENNRQER